MGNTQIIICLIIFIVSLISYILNKIPMWVTSIGALALLVITGCLTAFLTPMATPAVPMAMASGGYDLKDLLKGGWLITIIISVVYVLYTMTVMPCF